MCGREDRVGGLHRAVSEIVAAHRGAIEAHFPRILRRVSGYNLDEFVPGLPVRAEGWVDEPWKFNLARLIVGSEGTLAVVAGAELKVMPLPAAQGLVVISFATIAAALDRLEEILATAPVSVEMLDRMILDLAAGNAEMARHLTFAQGRPEAVLAAQFYADSPDELAARADDLARRFEGRPGVLGVRKSLSAAAKDDFWKVRKAGLSLLMGMVGDAKPIAFVEDTAVSHEKLPAFYERFRAILARHGVAGACYGHADVGCLHIRPIINVKTRGGVDQLRGIAREVAELVAEFGGAMSGEHGDGLARSLWNRQLFGPEVYSAFEAVKRAFDPEEPHESRQGRRRHRPRRGAADRPRVSRDRARPGVPRLRRAGGVRPRRGDVLGGRRVPQADRRDDVPELHGHARRGALDARAGERPSARDVRRAAGRWSGQRDPRSRPGPVPAMQGVQDGVPLERGHGEAQGRVPAPEVSTAARADRLAADGSHLPPQPDRFGDRAPGELDAAAARDEVAAGEGGGDRPSPDAALVRGRLISASGFVATRSTRGQGPRARWCCSTIASPPTTSPGSGSRRSVSWRRPGSGWTWRA